MGEKPTCMHRATAAPSPSCTPPCAPAALDNRTRWLIEFAQESPSAGRTDRPALHSTWYYNHI